MRWLPLIVLAGCVDIHGGSIDLAWELFSPSGSACCPNRDPCKAAGAQNVRVHLHPVTCDAAEIPARLFSCKITQGATAFDIPELPNHQSYCIAIDAADANGVAVASGPGPVTREVITGDVIELGAVALTVGDGTKCPADQNSCP